MNATASQTTSRLQDGYTFDHPQTDPANDLLSMDQQARALAKYIRQYSGTLPFTVGIFGEWGEGKTTLVALLYYHLCRPEGMPLEDPVFVTFSAWPYTTVDKLWRALILEIAQVVFGRKKSGVYNEPQSPPKPAPSSQPEEPTGMLARLAQFLNGDALVLRQPPTKLDEYDEFVGKLDSIDYGAVGQRAAEGQVDSEAAMAAMVKGAIAVLSSVSPLVAGLRGLFNLESGVNIGDVLKKSNQATREKIEALPRFQELFREMIRDKAHRKPVYIFIDDLDRCQPDIALDILESIRVALTSDECVFIIAVDERLIAQGLRLRYKELFASEPSPGAFATKGQEYLEKIIQFRVRVPPRGATQTQKLIAAQFPQWAAASDIIQAVSGTNPRRLKQYCYRLAFQHMVGQSPFALGLRRLEQAPVAEPISAVPVQPEIVQEAPTVDWRADEEQHLLQLLAAHQRRLRVMEQQQAMRGSQTPPEVVIEIEDIRHEIDARKAQLAQLRIERVTKLLEDNRRQLRLMEESQTELGVNAPPELGIKIRDLKNKISELDEDLAQLSSSGVAPTNKQSSRMLELEQLESSHRRRLQTLLTQQAMMGINTPPEILTEIDEINARLAELEQQRSQLSEIANGQVDAQKPGDQPGNPPDELPVQAHPHEPGEQPNQSPPDEPPLPEPPVDQQA
jgi:hypothetical protein